MSAPPRELGDEAQRYWLDTAGLSDPLALVRAPEEMEVLRRWS